ncbi:MAG: ubiquitin carboxyl-terminal hydrolase [Puniceicoccales bacterium]|nr:ubiquitin carboxyl-terminal hydrolase [Puniceicoccales bacterium]
MGSILDALPKPGGPVGIQRIGNTCYAIAAVQCIYRNQLYMNAVLILDKLGLGGDVVTSLATIFKYLNNPNMDGTTPRPCPGEFIQNLRRAVGRHESTFADENQHDCREFSISLLDLIRESFGALTQSEANALVERASLTQPEIDLLRWVGFYRPNAHAGTRICVDFGDYTLVRYCHTPILGGQPYPILNSYLEQRDVPYALSTKEGNLQAAIKRDLQQVLMDGDNSLYCPAIADVCPTIQKKEFIDLPPFLRIYLKRHRKEPTKTGEPNLQKDNRRFSFPSCFDASSFFNLNSGEHYTLQGTSCHCGTDDGGHWTFYGKINGMWYCLNDSFVTALPNFSIETLFGDGTTKMNAMELFYTRTSSDPPPS